MNVTKFLVSSAAMLLTTSALFIGTAQAAVTMDDLQGSTPPAGTVAKSLSSWGSPSGAIDQNLYTMWNAPSRVGSLELHFPSAQEVNAVQLVVNATPASVETYRIFGQQNNVWREISTAKTLTIYTNTPNILDPIAVTAGDYTAIRISITGTQSWAGINEITLLPGETKDETAPQTTLNVSGRIGDNGYYTSDAQLQLSATDDLSGVERTEYRLNSGEWTTYTGPIPLTDGQYTIEYRSCDKAGNFEAVQTSSLIQVDTIAPVTSIALPSNDQEWHAGDVDVELSATDNLSGVAKIEYRIDNGPWTTYEGTFQLNENGAHTIQYRSTDRAGNQSTIGAIEVKIDKTAPKLNLSVSESTLWSPNHKLVPIQVTVDASDDASGLASVVLTSITSNEPDEGTGDGDQANDIQNAAFGTNDTTFDLRAERCGNGTGRVYTITYTATDLAGNSTTATTTVTVPHSKKK